MNNINIFCPVFLPYSGGGASYFPLLANEFIKKEKQVTVYTEYHKYNKFDFLNPKIKVRRPFFIRDSIKRNRIINIFYFISNFFIFIYHSFKICCLDSKAIIIHTRYYNFAYLCYLFLLKLIFKKITLVNDVRTTFEKKFLNYNLNFFDITFSNSLAIDNQIRNNLNLSGKNYLNISNFLELPDIDVDYIPPVDFNFKSYYLFIGTLSKRKSFDVVLKVVKKLLNKGEKFVVVGRPVDYDINFILKYIHSENLIYYSNLSKSEIFYLQKNAKLVLLPSIKEGLPRVALETLSFHGRIVLPPCCPEFNTPLLNLVPNEENVYEEAKLRLKKGFIYNVSKHSVDNGFKEYYDFLSKNCNS